MQSPITVYVPASAGTVADEYYKIVEPDEQQNGTTGLSQEQNKPFYLLSQIDPRLKVAEIQASSGKINRKGEVTRSITEGPISLYGKDSLSYALKFIPKGGVSCTFFGKSPKFTLAGRAITVDEDDCPCVFRVTYQYDATQYIHIPDKTDLQSSDEQYPVAIRLVLQGKK